MSVISDWAIGCEECLEELEEAWDEYVEATR